MLKSCDVSENAWRHYFVFKCVSSISRSVVQCAKCGRVVGRSGTNKS